MDNNEYEAREKLRNIMIKEMLDEIDADTIKRFRNGERLVKDSNGDLHWTYFVNQDGKVVDENGCLL